MQVQKIFNSSAKQLTLKPKYQKPVYKSYRQLLQLDRPRKQIQYESSSSQQDFLQKLLNQQKAKARQKRKKSRKSTRQSAKQKGEKVKVVQPATKKQIQDQVQQKKPKNKFMNEIEEFLAQNKNPQADTNQQSKLQQTQNKSSPLLKTAKSKSSVQTKNFQRYTKREQTTRKDIVLNNPIFIDTKSVITPPIIHTSANHMFTTTLGIKYQEAYQHLISLKNSYQKRYSQEINLFDQDFSKTNKIMHKIQQSDKQRFTYSPNIEPLNPNWRINLTINPLAHRQKKQFPDRKVMFKSQQQQQRFIRSLSQFRSIK